MGWRPLASRNCLSPARGRWQGGWRESDGCESYLGDWKDRTQWGETLVDREGGVENWQVSGPEIGGGVLSIFMDMRLRRNSTWVGGWIRLRTYHIWSACKASRRIQGWAPKRAPLKGTPEEEEELPKGARTGWPERKAESQGKALLETSWRKFQERESQCPAVWKVTGQSNTMQTEKQILDMATRKSISRDQRESSFLRCVEEWMRSKEAERQILTQEASYVERSREK